MRSSKHFVRNPARSRILTTLAAACLSILASTQSQAWSIGGLQVWSDAPFQNINGPANATSSDGLLTISAWADREATVPASLYQWFWILGVSNDGSTTDNGAYIDESESMTLRYDKGVGASMISFLYSGGLGGKTNNLARVSISGFTSDPQAFPMIHLTPRISNLAYTNGVVSMDYLLDAGNDFGQLYFANAAASAGKQLKITATVSTNGDATSYGMGLSKASWQEVLGGPKIHPIQIAQLSPNSYTTPDGKVTIRGFSDLAATVPAALGTYSDECMGVKGGNNGSIDGTETITLQFANGTGLAKLSTVYASGQVHISGFASDPGFTDPTSGSFGATYADGVASFYPMDGGRHTYYFTNRQASAGRTLSIRVDDGYSFPVGSVEYSSLQTLIAPDLSAATTASFATPDGNLTVSSYQDLGATVAAPFYCNVDWAGVDGGGANREAIDGTESIKLQFSDGAGLTSFGTRYSSGRTVIDGFASDPGFNDPSGTATAVTYADGTLSYTFDAYRAPELIVNFTNSSASTNRTLSMHTDGNAGSQIALTRISYGVPTAPAQLNLTRSGNGIVLSWPAGTLQQSSEPGSGFQDMTGVTSPYTNAASATKQFFRVKVQ